MRAWACLPLVWALGSKPQAGVSVRPDDQPVAPTPAVSEPALRGALAHGPQPLPAPRQRGVALGLFAEDVGFSYRPLLEEIAALGATHVALIVPLYQDNGASTSLALHTRFSPTLAAIADATRAARREGLEVTLFPIVRLAHPRSANDWRGTLAPTNVDAWFASYGERLGELGALGTMVGASRLVVGSELSSLDGDRAHWTKLLQRVRGVFAGPLVYSANWDHYRNAALLDLVDEAGVTAYFNLREKGGPSDVPALQARWHTLRAELETWRKGRAQPEQPFVFTEVGYRSRAGCSANPWDENPGGAVDLDEQRRAFEAFRKAWAGASSLAGFYVWNWYGYGGPKTISYTPRGKPALEEVRALLRE